MPIDRNLLRDQYRQAVEEGCMTERYARGRLKILERLFKAEDKRKRGRG